MILGPSVYGKYIVFYLFNESIFLSNNNNNNKVQSTDFERFEIHCKSFAQPCVIVTLT